MVEWWTSLSGLEQTMVTIATPATLILVVQTIIILFSSFGGSDSDTGDFDDIDDFDVSDGLLSGIEIFTIKGFVTFFSIFGWSGLLFLRSDLNEMLSLALAFILGVIFMFLVAFAIKSMMKLQDSGNLEIKNALGATGTVYITIPKNRSGMGKVNAVVCGRYSEFDAVTDDDESIATGASIMVIASNPNNILVVTKTN